jgi:hypothetical protein
MNIALLGEVDLLGGQVLCPRSPPDSLAGFAGVRAAKNEWIVEGICAYVPQVKKPCLNTRVLLLSRFDRPLGLGMRLSKVTTVTDPNLHILIYVRTDNILFNLPLDEERYRKTLEVYFAPVFRVGLSSDGKYEGLCVNQ